eukprot:2277733-Prymnesium_polylepis.2
MRSGGARPPHLVVPRAKVFPILLRLQRLAQVRRSVGAAPRVAHLGARLARRVAARDTRHAITAERVAHLRRHGRRARVGHAWVRGDAPHLWGWRMRASRRCNCAQAAV